MQQAKVGTTMSVIASLLIILGLFTPAWLTVPGLVSKGLFFQCDDKAQCLPFPPGAYTSAYISALGLLVFAVVAALPGMCFAIIGCKGDPVKLQSSSNLILLAGNVAVVSVIVFAILTKITGSNVVQFYGFSFWISLVGGVMALLGGSFNRYASKRMNVGGSAAV